MGTKSISKILGFKIAKLAMPKFCASNVWLQVALALTSIITIGCGDGFSSIAVVEIKGGSYDLVPFSEAELSVKLDNVELDISLLPATELELEEHAVQCLGATEGTGSVLIGKYLGLGRSNSVYGTVIDLCSNAIPSVTVEWLEEGSGDIITVSMMPQELGTITINGTDHVVYIFAQQLSAIASQGIFWMNTDSTSSIGGMHEIIGAKTPFFYQVFNAKAGLAAFQ